MGHELDLPPYLLLLGHKFVLRAMKNKDAVILVSGDEGEGKCEIKDSRVLMANGEWKPIQDIVIGDLILSPQNDGSYIYAKVLETFSMNSETYDVTELNKTKKILYSCSANHKIPINSKVYPRNKNKERLSKDSFWEIKHYKAKDYADLSKNRKTNQTTFTSFPIIKFLGKENLKIEPYTLGVWLGDGHYKKSQIGITSADEEIMKEVLKFYKILRIRGKLNTKAKSYLFSTKGDLAKQLTEIGLKDRGSGDKFIPQEALLSDLEYRKRLLAGLIDSDGYLSKTMSYSITSKSKKLAEDILFLVYSLGGRGNIRKIKKGIKKLNFIGEYYHISFYLGNLKLPIQLKRKTKDNIFFYLSANRISIDVKLRNLSETVYGFTLDSPSGWYITDNFMITHNSTICMEIGAAICRAAKEELTKRGIPFKETDYEFSLKQNMIYSNEQTEVRTKLRSMPKYTPIVPDEAIKFLYKLNWASAGQKYINTLYALARRENKITILPIPRFIDVNEYFRNHRVRIWVHIIEEGYAVVFVKDKSAFNPKDPWLIQENMKIVEKIRKRKGFLSTTRDWIWAYSRCINFVKWFRFPGLPDPVYGQYDILSENKYEGLEDAFNIDERGRKIPYKGALRGMMEEMLAKGYDLNRLSYITKLNIPTINKILNIGEGNAKVEKNET